MIVIGFNTDPVWDVPTGSQTGVRLSGTNNRFPQTAIADFCFSFGMVGRGWILD